MNKEGIVGRVRKRFLKMLFGFAGLATAIGTVSAINRECNEREVPSPGPTKEIRSQHKPWSSAYQRLFKEYRKRVTLGMLYVAYQSDSPLHEIEPVVLDTLLPEGLQYPTPAKTSLFAAFSYNQGYVGLVIRPDNRIIVTHHFSYCFPEWKKITEEFKKAFITQDLAITAMHRITLEDHLYYGSSGELKEARGHNTYAIEAVWGWDRRLGCMHMQPSERYLFDAEKNSILSDRVNGVIIFPSCQDEQKYWEKAFDYVRNFSALCLKETTEEALKKIAEQGGHYNVPRLSTENIPYYLYTGQEYIPPIEEIQENLAKQTEQDILSCLNFKNFRDAEITTDSMPEITILFESRMVNVQMKYPVRIRQKKEDMYFNQFTEKVQSDFLDRYYHAVRIVEAQKDNSVPGICISCDMLISASTGFLTETVSGDDGTTYVVRKERDDLLFRFAIK